MRRIRLLIPLALTALQIAALGSGATATQEEAPTQEDVQAALEVVVEAGVPGIVLAIRSPEGGAFLVAGDASLKQERLLRHHALFRERR
jgi:hypothetical protein